MKNLVGHETAADGMPMVNFSAYGANTILRKLGAQRKTFHACLGTPEGLHIPDKPLPAASRSAVDTTPMNQQVNS